MSVSPCLARVASRASIRAYSVKAPALGGGRLNARRRLPLMSSALIQGEVRQPDKTEVHIGQDQ